MSTPAARPRLRDALEPWCAAGASGALRVLDPPGGAVYLVDGSITYAECSGIGGVDRLLTASGRVSAEAWRTALAAGRPANRVGVELVAGGHVTRAELESLVRLALHDAAYFLFDTAATVQFESGAAHLLGPTCQLDLGDVGREVDRRKRLLLDAWPDPAIDTAAVVPARRLAGQSVALTSMQWEVVANADRRRSPVDLARLLGRDTFTVLLSVRRLARAGLVEPGRPGGSAAAESVATVRARAAVPPAALPVTVADRPEEPPAPVLLGEHEPLPRRPPPRGEHGPLPRRPPPGGASYPPGRSEAGCTEETLRRILAGLAALP